LEQAAKAGFTGIEIFYEDIDYAARKISGSDSPSNDDLLQAADHVNTVCKVQGLEIIGLQPFLFYEGLKDREQHERLIEKMEFWLQIVKTLGTTTIQIPANFLPAEQLSDGFDSIAADLR
jgi:4-hydroxyphenylpyruvate dioxygenase